MKLDGEPLTNPWVHKGAADSDHTDFNKVHEDLCFPWMLAQLLAHTCHPTFFDRHGSTEFEKDEAGQDNEPPPGLGNDCQESKEDGVGRHEPPPMAGPKPIGSHLTPCSQERSLGSAVASNTIVEKCLIEYIAVGGAPSWTSSRIAMLQANATMGQRVSFMDDTQGWLATDQMTHIVHRMARPNSAYTVLPIAHYIPITDSFVFERDNCNVPNFGITLIPVLDGAHWVGVEIDRQQDQPEICILQAPTSIQSRMEVFVSHLLQIPPHRLTFNAGMDNHVPIMCGWALAYRWIALTHSQTSFQDVLARLYSLSDLNRRIVLRSLQKAANDWAKTGASHDLQQTAHALRMSFLVNLL